MCKWSRRGTTTDTRGPRPGKSNHGLVKSLVDLAPVGVPAAIIKRSHWSALLIEREVASCYLYRDTVLSEISTMNTNTKRKYTTAFEEGPAHDLLHAAIAQARSRSRPAVTVDDGQVSASDETTNISDNALVARLDYSENGALQFANSGYAPLDLFFGLVRSSSSDQIENLISSSFSENAFETIQVLMHARDARNGKGERAVVRQSMMWLRRNKPITYLRNINTFVSLGYFKDLLQIAAAAAEAGEERLGVAGNELVELELFAAYLLADHDLLQYEMVQTNEEQASKVALSLAAKYAPSEGRSFDKRHQFASRMANMLFPDDTQPKRQYRSFLSKARAQINIVEAQMSNGQWSNIAFGQVPSRAHRTYRKAFMKHDEERYEAYLAAVKDGRDTIKSTGTQPHELVHNYLKSYYDRNVAVDETVEAQWNEMITRLKSSGRLSQSLSIVDVSGSMFGQPIEVAVSLGLVTAEMNEGPFHGRTITFSTSPKWEIVRGDTLRDKVQNLSKAHWDMSTNLEKVFDLILSTAIRSKVAPEHMPKTLFIFSDMQFDQALRRPNTDTLYRMVRRKYLVHNYAMPNVVFWNLRASAHGAQLPITMDEAGTALVSGFSAELLKLFMDGEEMNPMSVFRRAIAPYKAEVEESEI